MPRIPSPHTQRHPPMAAATPGPCPSKAPSRHRRRRQRQRRRSWQCTGHHRAATASPARLMSAVPPFPLLSSPNRALYVAHSDRHRANPASRNLPLVLESTLGSVRLFLLQCASTSVHTPPCLASPKPPPQEKSRSAAPVPFIHVLQSRRGAKRFLSLRPHATDLGRPVLVLARTTTMLPSILNRTSSEHSHLLIRPTLASSISSSLASSSPIAFRNTTWTPSHRYLYLGCAPPPRHTLRLSFRFRA